MSATNRMKCDDTLSKLPIGADCPPDMARFWVAQSTDFMGCRVVEVSQMQQAEYVAQNYWVGRKVMLSNGRLVDQRLFSITCANGKVQSVFTAPQ